MYWGIKPKNQIGNEEIMDHLNVTGWVGQVGNMIMLQHRICPLVRLDYRVGGWNPNRSKLHYTYLNGPLSCEKEQDVGSFINCFRLPDLVIHFGITFLQPSQYSRFMNHDLLLSISILIRYRVVVIDSNQGVQIF